ncbi:choline dehydrogenase [bacterium]|nr:choline dehydrogenase [bacterium]
MEFDDIIVGAGSAGCLLANRLSADPSRRVLVLEAGGRDDWIWFHIPVGYLFAIGDPRADWRFATEPVPGLGGRSLAYPRGRVIGGSSAINGMIYMRGQAADYDGWRQMGLPGWGWEDVLPFFLAHEDHVAPPGPLHRSGGEWRVEEMRLRWAVLDAFADAMEACGVPRVADFNSGDNEGVSYFQVNQRRGVRVSAATAFLKPALSRANLTLATGALVERLLFEADAGAGGRQSQLRASGVRWREGGAVREARASRITLCAGAVMTPVLLERSGIGDGERLKRLGVDVVQHLPGVGENLQDHLQLRPVYRVSGVPTLNEQYAQVWRRPLMALDYALRRRGPMTMAPSQLGAFARSSDRFATANLEFHVQPLSLDRFGEPLHRFPAITASVCNLRPESRGAVHALGPSPDDPPSIQPNYLATEGDRVVAVDALRLVRRIVAAPPFARYAPQEVAPGPEAVTDAELASAAARIGTTIFHPVGTARMGRADDPMAVVDARLRVRGVDGLRVVDASVMPTITSGNTNSPVLMIAEKAAAMMREDDSRG